MNRIIVSLGLLALAAVFYLSRQNMSDAWEWLNPTRMDVLNLILALGGIALGAPNALQAFFGRPKIQISFSHSMAGEQTSEAIGVYIKNRPLMNKWLDGLGISRMTVEDVVCNYQIEEAESGKEIIGCLFPVVATGEDQLKKRFRLAPSEYAYFIGLGAVKDKKFYIHKEGKPPQLLSVGKYRVRLTAHFGNKALVKVRNLIVRDSDPYAFWEVGS